MSGAARPLAGRRVLLTRRREQAEELAAALQAAGAEVSYLPLLHILPPLDPAAVARAARGWSTAALAVFTSRNGVEQFARIWRSFDVPAAPPALAAIGAGTAAAIREQGWPAPLVPVQQDAEGLAEAIIERRLPPAAEVLLMQADNAAAKLRQRLLGTSPPHRLQEVIVYRGVTDLTARLPADLAAYDAVVFASSATVKRFHDLPGCPPCWPASIAIGPRTAATLQELGQIPRAVAEQPDIPHLVAATLAALG